MSIQQKLLWYLHPYHRALFGAAGGVYGLWQGIAETRQYYKVKPDASVFDREVTSLQTTLSMAIGMIEGVLWIEFGMYRILAHGMEALYKKTR